MARWAASYHGACCRFNISESPWSASITCETTTTQARQERTDMIRCIGKFATLLSVLALACGLTTAASAQVFTGRMDVTVEDSTGGRLPGVTVDLTGPVNQTQVTDTLGQAHFLNLPVGTYSVKTNLPGFNPYSNTNLQVVSGVSVNLPIRLAVAGTAETINVTAATPVIDIKKETT